MLPRGRHHLSPSHPCAPRTPKCTINFDAFTVTLSPLSLHKPQIRLELYESLVTAILGGAFSEVWIAGIHVFLSIVIGTHQNAQHLLNCGFFLKKSHEFCLITACVAGTECPKNEKKTSVCAFFQLFKLYDIEFDTLTPLRHQTIQLFHNS